MHLHHASKHAGVPNGAHLRGRVTQDGDGGAFCVKLGHASSAAGGKFAHCGSHGPLSEHCPMERYRYQNGLAP